MFIETVSLKNVFAPAERDMIMRNELCAPAERRRKSGNRGYKR